MKVQMKMEKVTKNKVKFTEVLASELDAPKIGDLYVPKTTLGEIGWGSGKAIYVTVEAE